MSSTYLQQIFWALLIQSPTFVASLIGFIITIVRWNDAPSAAIWALLGFGLSIIISIGMPAGQAATQLYLVNNHFDREVMSKILSAVAIGWSVLRAASYGALVAAVFSGRPKKQSDELR